MSRARCDLLLGQAYFLKFDPKLWAARQPYPPLGALYAAACVREAGHEVVLFDAMLADSVAEWDHALDRERPRVAALFEDSFNYLSKMCLLRMREAALSMIASARARGVPVLVAGSDATDHPELYLDGGADGVMVEVHPDPDAALSDAEQQLDLDLFRSLMDAIVPVHDHVRSLHGDPVLATAGGPVGGDGLAKH